MIKYLSGRVKRTPQDRLSEDRYDYLDVKQAEPNLADPATSPPVPSGAQFQLVAVPGYPGKRYWVPVGGGLIPGAISIFDEGSLVSSASSITQLNFVGAAVTAQVSVQSPSGFPGIAATITVNPVTILDTPPLNPRAGELWWESDTGDLYLYYEDADSSQWVTTNTGGRGDPGTDGDKGQKGEVGAQGLSGSAGTKGQKGEEGDKGDTGLKGDKGAVDEKGNKGDQGQKGEEGVKGVKGEVGQKGDKGDKGDEGDKGVKGEVGGQGVIGGQGDKAGLRYQYSHNTGMSDPGGGIFRYDNSSTLGSISAIAIDATTKEGTDLSDYIATWDDSSNDTIKGHIIVKSNLNGDATYTVLEVTNVTDNTGWLQITVQNATGNFPTNNEECVIQFYRTGNKGEKGQKGEKGTKGDKGQKGSGTQITIADAAPGSGNNGDLWWASDDFDLHVYYDDGDSSQWVSITSNTSLKGAKGDKGDKGEIGVKGQKGEGDKGEKGADNSTKGQKGEAEKGDKGEVGDKGDKGADNSTKGDKGETGADNSTKGDKGDEGDKGEPGSTIKGDKGVPGADNSSKGDKGDEGDKGDKGSEAGNAGTVTVRTDSADAYHNLVFVDNATDNQDQVLKMDDETSRLQWNPNDENLVAYTTQTQGLRQWSNGSLGSSGQVLTSGGSGSQWNWQNVSSLSGGVPTGTITMFGSSSAPTGWQLCNGGTAATSALQSIVGTNVPDLRDKFIVGAGNNYSQNAGGGYTDVFIPEHTHASGTLQNDNDTHNHRVRVGTAGGGGGGNVSDRDSEQPGTYVSNQIENDTHSHTISGSTAKNTGGAAITNAQRSGRNLPPYYALTYIIKT